MLDDFNTPEALAALFGAARQAGREISERLESRHEFLALKKAFDELMGHILGFDLGRDQTIFVPFVDSTQRAAPLGAKEIREKLIRREQARQANDYALADQLRDEIQAEGWAIEDTPEGPVLRPS
jgi:cysteinyl-tRNA synthetase